MPRKVFVAGEILTAADVNTNLMDQAVMVFDDDTARGSAIPSPSEGMVTYLKDVNQVQAFDGSAFTPVGRVLQIVTAESSANVATTNSSFVTTGLSATITPSSTTSKVWVLCSSAFTSEVGANLCVITLFRGDTTGTNLGAGTNGFGAITSGAGSIRAIGTVSFVDSPNTTSAQAYTFAMRSPSGTTVRSQVGDSKGTITLVEVAG